ncbi:hypothetical protein N0V84_000034 [Fusarium piperis]|uniref:Uncharacterized protein n=1 Tax=Fusarium piperis TaxID=1435070 RepID=A0A9W8WNC5_9HYPO|nr:hypothetical protein N0V84_000034 [Fusarium piperis]
MPKFNVPINRKQWFQARKHHDPADIGISGFGANALGSASRLSYQDWLLLKIVWPRYNHRPNHTEFFGDKGPSRSKEALAALSKEDWWEPLTEGEGEGESESDKRPWSWKQLAAWKQSANDIAMRKPFDPDPAGIMFDPTDPFRFDVQPPPEPASRPRRHQSDRHAQEKAEREAQLQRLDQYVYGQSPNQSPPPLGAGHGLSPTGSERLGSSSGSPGSTGRAQLSAASFNDGSSEGKFINRHRPDEAIINMSMVLLLQGVCMSLLQTQEYELYDWTILHKLFTISQPDPDNEGMRRNILTAKTDGCLQARHKGRDPDKGNALAIMEAKPYRRYSPEDNAIAIRIQEGAEMAAWISTEARKGLLPSRSDDKTIYRRLLISQDFDQVFLTIAEFDEQYIRQRGVGDCSDARPFCHSIESCSPCSEIWEAFIGLEVVFSGSREQGERREQRRQAKRIQYFRFQLQVCVIVSADHSHGPNKSSGPQP